MRHNFSFEKFLEMQEEIKELKLLVKKLSQESDKKYQ
jgi:hypothetical protein